MPSGAANASSNANGRWRRNRKDELNDTRPNRSSQFFETQLAEGAGRRDHLNGTICPAADWQGRLACPMREPAEDPTGIGIAQTAMLFSSGRQRAGSPAGLACLGSAIASWPASRGPHDRQPRRRRLASRCSHGMRTAGPDRSADVGLRGLRIGDRYLPCADGPGPVMDDRTHFLY